MLTIRYSSTREEIWAWYWWAWAKPSGLWRFHIVMGLLIGVLLVDRQNFALAEYLLWSFVGFLAGVLILPIWPQIRFKPQERILSIGPEGFRTEIGKRSGEVPWRKVRRIDDDGEVVAITGSSGNAMVIPKRAFADPATRKEFIQAAQGWLAEAKI